MERELRVQCLLWMGKHEADAEDALSRATVKALERYADSPPQENPRAWFFRVVHNTCMDIHRERKRLTKTLDILDTETIRQLFSMDFSSGISPEEELISRELLANLRSVIKSLPNNLRVPFECKVFKGMSYHDIAVTLGIRADCARKRVQLARRQIRRHLNWA